MNRKTIMYIPDYQSQHAQDVTKALRDAFPEWKVICVPTSGEIQSVASDKISHSRVC